MTVESIVMILPGSSNKVMVIKNKPRKRRPGASRKSEPAGAEPQSRPAPQNQACAVIGFGASAGGLEAFTDVLQHIPPHPGFAMVLVQHLDPKHSSILTELLSRATSLPVQQVQHGTSVKPNHVYVIPPNTNMSIAGGT